MLYPKVIHSWRLEHGMGKFGIEKNERILPYLHNFLNVWLYQKIFLLEQTGNFLLYLFACSSLNFQGIFSTATHQGLYY